MIGSLVLLAGLLAEGAGLALELQARLPPTGGAELLTIIFSNATLDLARCEVCVNTSVGGVLRDGKCFSGSDVAHATVRITGAPGKYRASGGVRCGAASATSSTEFELSADAERRAARVQQRAERRRRPRAPNADDAAASARRGRVFVVGLPKTGTLTLHHALGSLGLASVHFRDERAGGEWVGALVARAAAEGRPLLAHLDEARGSRDDSLLVVPRRRATSRRPRTILMLGRLPLSLSRSLARGDPSV